MPFPDDIIADNTKQNVLPRCEKLSRHKVHSRQERQALIMRAKEVLINHHHSGLLAAMAEKKKEKEHRVHPSE